MRILKFGGSSVSSADRIKNIIRIVKEKFCNSEPLAVVVSAFGGVTDELIRISQQAALGQADYSTSLLKLKKRHCEVASSLLSTELFQVLAEIDRFFNELNNALQGVLLIRELSNRTLDFIMGFGERLSAYIISMAMKSTIPSALYLDARELIITDRNFGEARVLYEPTFSKIKEKFTRGSFLPVITGFIGATERNEATTLGRGGSDFTASIIGAALNALEIEIWTDVNGVMTADPRKVQQAFTISEMSYKEALEMSHFGAKVIHPPTIVPALQRNIPLRIKNSFKPNESGTLISRQPKKNGSLIRGISSIDHIALLRIEGSGMIGVCGVAMRLFGALAKRGINVILISQGSSEHSICLGISPQCANFAKIAIEEEFALERKVGNIDAVIVEKNLSVIAVVGEGMRHTSGISGKLFGALGKNGINVVAMVQGSSEYNISVVIKQEDETKALNVIHEEFFLPKTTTLNLFLVGVGLIGSTLLTQIQKQLFILKKEYGLEVRLIGIANRKKMMIDPNGLPLENWRTYLEKSSATMEIEIFIKRMKACNLVNTIFVDCTADEKIGDTYATILESNISIVTPNKKANSGSYSQYQVLKQLSKSRGVKYYYETNVGAGLPIISTVIDLLKSGDRIIKIEAILSGTLSYLFNSISSEKSFSSALKEAQQNGFTEPDPKEDLNGKDVMRKLLILARESGYAMELEDIEIEYLVPAECFETATIEAFYLKLKDLDDAFEQVRKKASQEGKVLRYMAILSSGRAKIALQALDAQHPFYHLSGSDNIIALTTERYQETPLVIKGQGAGAEVTAGEIFADILRVATH
jgi:bifunctional aspartokinase / homoserine dehydrogenase 1